MHQARADDVNGISIQNMAVQPYDVKVGDTFTVVATLVNNSTVQIAVDGGKCSAQDTQAEIFTMILDNHVKNKAENINCAGVGWSQILDPGKSITGTSPDYTTNYVATESGTTTITVTFSYHAIIQRDPIQTSDEQTISKSFQFQVRDVNSDSSGPPILMPGTISPLQQFKSGITANHIMCKKDLYVILKAENNLPACVDVETGKKLVQRGWATTFEINMNDYWSTCNKYFPPSNSSTPVLYMPVNSIGKICLRYSNYNNEPETVIPPGISDPNDSYQRVKDITIWTYTPISTISKDNGTTVAYFIKTGNQTGFYGLSIPSCGEIPFAVGYNNDSNITSSDFPFLGVTVSCPPGMLYPQFDGIEGIGIKYIPYP